MAGLDTIDIQDLVDNFSEDLLNYEAGLIVSSAIAGSPWFLAAGPIAKAITDIFHHVVKEILRELNKQLGFIAFRFNSVVWSTDQGKDYIATIEKRNKMPDDVSDEEWDKAELEANHAMRNLVNYRR